MYTAEQSYELSLLMLCIWREARGESSEAQHAVGWVIKNRATRGGWFGKSIVDVILKPAQFSSFGWQDKAGKWHFDANATKLPVPATDSAFGSCMLAAKHVYDGTSPDPTRGSTYYFDDSLAADPPAWAKGFTSTVKIGRLNFFRDK